MPSDQKLSEVTSNDNSTSRRINIYFSKEALSEEFQLAKRFDEAGYAGMFNSSGRVNRSNLVNTCYLVLSDKNDLVAKKTYAKD